MTATPTNVVVNATPLLSNRTGVGQVAFEISSRLSFCPEFNVKFFTPFRNYPSLESLQGDADNKIQCACRGVLRKIPFKRALRRLYSRTIPKSREEPCDLYWEPNYIPLESTMARRVVTTVYDMSVFDCPEWHPSDRVDWFRRSFFKNIRRSDVVTTISEFSKQRFLECQQEIREDRVRVIPCGLNPDVFRILSEAAVEEFRRQYRLPAKFILFIGTLEPRKNLVHLLSAYGHLPPAFRDEYPLILAGDTGWNNAEIIEKIAGFKKNVRHFGYIKRQSDLALIYNAASVFAFPSLYEGFGIPPLEAMACGTPVCLSSIPVFHEVYGTVDVCYGDPYDAESFACALQGILSDKVSRKRLVDRGLLLSAQYTWDRAFAGYHSVFRDLLQ